MINPQSKIKIKIPTNHKPTPIGEDGFDSIFEGLKDTNDNSFYCIKTDKKNMTINDNCNGQLIHLPIPNTFKTKTGVLVHKDNNNLVFPILVYLEKGLKESETDISTHICDRSSNKGIDKKGTECAEFLQLEPSLYFNTTKNEENKEIKQIPDVKNNSIFQEIVNKYKDKESLYYLPTRTTNNSIIYIVFTDKNKLNEFIAKAPKKLDYFIALNGFFVPIDAWNCSLLFQNDVTLGVTSEAVIVND